ncbi:ATP-binding protein [Paucibacter sp. AS339]|uniref:ATP-binding protein n=1 Tax=Paucibacter hankyongi TaxID=3133434 RepID=UPI0030B3C31F
MAEHQVMASQGAPAPSLLKPPADCWTLSLPNRLDALETARLALLAHLAPLALPDKLLFTLELVLEEVLMNVKLHAFQDEQQHLSELKAWFDDAQLYLRFEDEGLAFDPTQAAEPAVPSSIAEAPTGGRGLLLVRKRASHMQYQRVGERNQLTIALARP